MEEVEPQHSHEEKDQEAAGARTEKAVVETEDEGDGRRQECLGAGGVMGSVNRSEVSLEEGLHEHGHEQKRQYLPQPVTRHPRDDDRPDPATGDRGEDRRQDCCPGKPHPPDICRRGEDRAADAGQLVGAEECGGRSRGEGPEHHRNRHQSAAAGDGIDEARGEGGESDRGDFKHWESVRGRESPRIPGVRCGSVGKP